MASVHEKVLIASSISGASTLGSAAQMASKESGFIGYMDLTAVNGTASAFIEHSPDGTNWFVVATFAPLAAPGREVLPISASLFPYVRGRVDIAGGLQTATVRLSLFSDKGI